MTNAERAAKWFTEYRLHHAEWHDPARFLTALLDKVAAEAVKADRLLNNRAENPRKEAT
jgi:hypothetical protein